MICLLLSNTQEKASLFMLNNQSTYLKYFILYDHSYWGVFFYISAIRHYDFVKASKIYLKASVFISRLLEYSLGNFTHSQKPA